MPKLKIFLILLVFAVAAFFRFYNLDQIPPGLYPDVAVNGNDALAASQSGDYKPYYPDNNGREGLFINIIGLSFSVFGPSAWTIKIVAAIFGILTIFGLYLLTKQLFKHLDKDKKDRLLSSDLIALLTTFFMSVGFWHVNFSRIGFRAIMVPFVLVWCFYFLVKATGISETKTEAEKKPMASMTFWLFAGLFFGLGLHTYIAWRLSPLALVPLFVFDMIRHRPGMIKRLGRWLVFALGILIAASPMIYYYAQNPADFMGRAGQVSVFSSDSPAKVFTESALKTFGQFVAWGDGNWRHNFPPTPQIYWPLIPFFLIGLGYFIYQIFRKKNYKNSDYKLLAISYTLLAWWLALLLPSILTNEGLPHALRSIGAIPPSFIFTGLGFFLFIDLIDRKVSPHKDRLIAYRAVAWSLVLFGLLALGTMEYFRYFDIWGRHPETKAAFTQKFVDEARYLNALPADTKKAVLANEGGVPVPYPDGIPMPAQTIMFLTHDSEVTFLKENEFSGFLESIRDTHQKTVILPMRFDEKIFSQMRQTFPNGKSEIMRFEGFAAYKINF